MPLTIRIIHQHDHVHRFEGEELMAISAAFQAQLDRLKAFVTSLEGGAVAQDAEDTATLASTLDTAGAPPAPVAE